jgi:transcriptional antiterminator RfaH
MSWDWENPLYREDHWFCLRTGSKQELRVLRQVAVVEGVEAYCPMVAYRKLRAGHPMRVEEAMFPRFGLLEQGRHLLSLSGVKGLVEFGGKPAMVDEGIIRALQELTAGEPVVEVRQEISPGRRAVILQGAYVGLEVLVTRVLSAGERVAVLLEVLGSEREVEIQREALLPPAEHPLANSTKS